MDIDLALKHPDYEEASNGKVRHIGTGELFVEREDCNCDNDFLCTFRECVEESYKLYASLGGRLGEVR